MESLGWAGPDVSYAHAVFVDPAEVATMARYGAGVAHCPSSNMRLASGIAPVAGYLGAGVPVGIGVDGSASNDGSHLLGEARQALLLARLAAAPPLGGGGLLPVRAALEMATRGGARVVGRDDIGALETGRCADFTAISLDRIGYAGAGHDPVATTLLAAPVSVDHTYVHGRPVVSAGELVGVEAGRLVERHNAASARLVAG
jgi:cytosine/adenosine deaminase-related metal-dependent hydrolase